MSDILLWILFLVGLCLGLFLGFLLGKYSQRSPSNDRQQQITNDYNDQTHFQSDQSVSTASQTDIQIFQNLTSKSSNKYSNSNYNAFQEEGEEEIKLEKDDVQQDEQSCSRKFSNTSSNNNYFDDNISSEHSEISDFMGGSTSPDEFLLNKRKSSLTQQTQSKQSNQGILGQEQQSDSNKFNDEFTEEESSSELQSSSQPQKETNSQSITSSVTNGTLEKTSSNSNNINLALVPVKDTQIVFPQQQNKIDKKNEEEQLIRGRSDSQEVEHHALINEIGGYVQRSKSSITTGSQSVQKTVLSEKSEKELFFEQCPLQDQPTRKQAEFKIEYEQDKKKGIFRKIETHQVVVDYPDNSKIEKEVQDVKMSLLQNFNLKDSHSLNGFKISQAKFFMPLPSIPELDQSILNNNQLNNLNNRQLAVYQQPQPQSSPAHVIPIFDYGNFKEYLDNGKFKKFFKVIEELGRGGFGRVYKVQCSNEDKTYAIKKIVVPFDRDTNPKNHKYFREVTSIMSINHIHIVRYHTSWWEFCDAEMLTQVNEFLQTTNNSQNQSSSSSSDNNSNSIENHNQSQNQPQSNSNQNDNQTNSVVEISYPELSCIEWDQTEQNKEKNSTLNQKTVHTAAEKLPSGSNKNNSHRNHKITGEKQAVHSFKHQNKSHKAFNFSKNSQLLTLYIQLEYCSGKTLRNFLDERETALSYHAAFDIFSQVLDGVLCLHSNGIIHRDLKPSNILLDNSVVKIGDFGLSIKQDMEVYNNTNNYDKNSSFQSTEDIKSSSVTHTSNVGTPFYMPPEQSDKSGKYNEKIDIFSLGIILLEMIYKTTTHHEKLDVFRKLKLSQELPQKLSATRKHECSLILTMTHPDPISRPSVKAILESSSFSAWRKKAKQSQQKEDLYVKSKQQQ